MSPPPPQTVPCWKPSPDSPLDPRVDAFRPDLADAGLAGRVDSAHLAEPVVLRCNVARSTVHLNPVPTAEACSELLFGEMFNAVERGPDWLWGWCQHDHYVGYVRAAEYEIGQLEATHRVSARSAPLFLDPGIKHNVSEHLPLGALLSLVAADDAFFQDAALRFVHRRHVVPVDEQQSEPIEVASRLLGSPYVWGGRTGEGIDCSGLTQVAFGLCDIALPRDCDLQMKAFETSIALAEARRGDLVFFPGHVGIMADGANLLHANAHWMTTLIEPLADVVARLAPMFARPVLAVKRL